MITVLGVLVTATTGVLLVGPLAAVVGMLACRIIYPRFAATGTVAAAAVTAAFGGFHCATGRAAFALATASIVCAVAAAASTRRHEAETAARRAHLARLAAGPGRDTTPPPVAMPFTGGDHPATAERNTRAAA